MAATAHRRITRRRRWLRVCWSKVTEVKVAALAELYIESMSPTPPQPPSFAEFSWQPPRRDPREEEEQDLRVRVCGCQQGPHVSGYGAARGGKRLISGARVSAQR